MVTMLVCFTKSEDGNVFDRQYHVFDNCPEGGLFPGNSIAFVHDSIFQGFISMGYTWSSCPLPSVDLAHKCCFTVSDCEC